MTLKPVVDRRVDMAELVLADPGPAYVPAGVRPRPWVADLEFIREHAPRWVKCGPYTRSYAAKINRGHLPSIDPEKYQAVMRTTDADGDRAPAGKSFLFIRYIADGYPDDGA